MAIKEDIKRMGSRLHLDAHHGIERFGVMFTIMAVVFLSIMTTAGVSASKNNAAQLDSTALYVSSFSTSKTQLSGLVPGVYVSPERTRAVVLMKFREPTLVPASADNYQAFLTGSTLDMGQTRLETSVRGEIVVFGSTGYLGVVIDSDQPFPQQIMNLTVRSNSELVYQPGDSKIRADLRDDDSFVTHDQWRLYFNPGASGVITSESLGSAAFDAGAFYAEAVTAGEEQVVREDLEELLLKMRSDLAVIDEFEDQLGRTSTTDGDFLVPVRGDQPQDPMVPITGDAVTGEPAAAEGEVSTLALDADWVAPNGFDFDWRAGSVYEGYLDELVPEGERYGTWLADKALAGKGESTFNKSSIVWALSDGTLLSDALSTRSTSVMAPLSTLKTNLENAYDTYYRDKIDYQVKLPAQLLELEIVLRNVQASASINDEESALLVY